MGAWGEWRAFPDPRSEGVLVAPYGPGVYELRERKTGALVYVGSGGNCAERMTSLLPAPLGCGTRKNARLRQHVLDHLADVEYRTQPSGSAREANAFEKSHRATGKYLFST